MTLTGTPCYRCALTSNTICADDFFTGSPHDCLVTHPLDGTPSP